MAALAFVPLGCIDDAWLDIQPRENADHPAYSALEDFKNYFIQTWLENDALFPRNLWNHHRNFGARSTNHREGWHQALDGAVGKAQVNVFEIIRHLQEQ